MITSAKQLQGLRVETKSGAFLGRISDFIFDTDSQEVFQYEIKKGLLGGFLGKSLLIHRRQVIEINEKKMIVEDGSIKQGKLVPAIDIDV